MTTEKLILHIPAAKVNRPVICQMSHQYDITFNILRAEITEDEDGLMILEVSGKRRQVRDAIDYLRDGGIGVEQLSARTSFSKKLCTHCGACLAHCPTGALAVDEKLNVKFVSSKCIGCGLCVPACPFAAIEMRYAEVG